MAATKEAVNQRAYRERLRKKGYKNVLIWIKKEHEDRLRRYVKRLNETGEG